MPRLLLFGLLACVSGCVPYAVGTTPATAPRGTVVPSTTVQVAAGQPDLGFDPADADADERTTTFTFDNAVHFGLDDRSEAGARLVGSSGVVATYKRRLTPSGPRRIATAVLVGGGIVGLGSHAHVEATLLGAYPLRTMTPYGGVRVQHLFPLGNDAPAPDPAFGAFFGVRLGEPDLGISPELGLFYSPTDTLFETDWVIVPSVTVHGNRLLQALGIGF